jgi:hypothetical protein
MPYIETQQELTQDALARGYTPGAVVRRVDGGEVQLTSYPYFEGEGDARTAIVMARLDVGDCRTNREIRYFTLMKFVRTEVLDG